FGAAHDAARKFKEQDLEAARAGAALVERTPFGEKCVEAKCSLLAAAVADRDRVPMLELDLNQQIDRAIIEGSRLHQRHDLEQAEALQRCDQAKAVFDARRTEH